MLPEAGQKKDKSRRRAGTGENVADGHEGVGIVWYPGWMGRHHAPQLKHCQPEIFNFSILNMRCCLILIKDGLAICFSGIYLQAMLYDVMMFENEESRLSGFH